MQAELLREDFGLAASDGYNAALPDKPAVAPNAVNHFDRWVATTAKCVIPA
jgi:hypothetical protein